jgi:hypothetical protein
MLQRYLNGPVPKISHSILSLLYTLVITEESFKKFSGGITNSLNFHAAEYITCFYHSFPSHKMAEPFWSH